MRRSSCLSHLRAIICLLLPPACSGPGPAQVYVDAARLAPTDPEAAAEACERVGARLRDECLGFTAAAAARTDTDLARRLCTRCGPSAWRDECFFLVAEATVPVAGGERAAELCASAGQYARNCLDHVWRAHAGALLARHEPAVAAARYAEARSWLSGPAGDDRQVDGRFWQKFYDAPLHDASLPPLDARWCDAMEGRLATTCRQTVPAAFRHTLVRLERERQTQGQPVDPDVLCAGRGDDASRVMTAFGLTWVRGAELDEVAGRFVVSQCARVPPSSTDAQHAGERPGGIR